MKFPIQQFSLTIIRFLPIICRNMLDWFHNCLGFLLVLFHLHWGLYLMHLWIEINQRYIEIKYGVTKKDMLMEIMELLFFEAMTHWQICQGVTVGFQKYFTTITILSN